MYVWCVHVYGGRIKNDWLSRRGGSKNINLSNVFYVQKEIFLGLLKFNFTLLFSGDRKVIEAERFFVLGRMHCEKGLRTWMVH